MEISPKRSKRRMRKTHKKILGTKECPRLSVYKSIKHIYAQLIDDGSEKTLLAASDLEQVEKAKNQEVSKAKIAFEVGISLGKKAKVKGITKVTFDRGGYKYHGRVQKLAEGAREGGLKF